MYCPFQGATFVWNTPPALPETRLILHFPGVGHLISRLPVGYLFVPRLGFRLHSKACLIRLGTTCLSRYCRNQEYSRWRMIGNY
ncbi:hypothetical protein BO86DRAFT_191730 [Aspergillus japonicus CBS 114.51]|uniref:Uncharacterized protein n=1 Tax=Aspergillus japonicus CBS 114.51 TaxID=1448312 RepID=A0A8T8WQV3_ASPJA|nr:hypothetical protein BO86DRAFT_191730 [Aspergillus japonicus CBS 114.51]RAH78225.1 hypothetical protein BO86DRAFT_191730 [Aspergillus japonicus CBS 114.51]